MKVKKTRQMTQTAFMTPETSGSRKRSATIENSTMRYDANAKKMMMNQMMSQNDMWGRPFSWGSDPDGCAHRHRLTHWRLRHHPHGVTRAAGRVSGTPG